jgi:prophage tail gpP-like protein
MATRQPDKIEVLTDAGVLEKFSSLEIVNDIAGPTEASFDLGDDGAWSELETVVTPGASVMVRLNGKLRLTGRAEVNEVPGDSNSGMIVRLTVRTKMADARYASADPNVKVKDSSIKDFVLACYAELGYTEADFEFAPFAARDLMTGEAGGAAPPFELAPIQEDQAKVNPPETVFEAVERHLRRHRGTHWDAPDGRIIVGAPDDEQAPRYSLQCKRGVASKANNVLRFNRIADWSEVPSEVVVYGQTSGRDVTRSSVKGTVEFGPVKDVATRTGHFTRRVIIADQSVKSLQQAEQKARRELSSRIRRYDAWDFTVDGWSYFDGTRQIPWATNTTTDVDVDVVGGVQGRYLIHQVALSLGTGSSATSRLTLAGPGVWLL